MPRGPLGEKRPANVSAQPSWSPESRRGKSMTPRPKRTPTRQPQGIGRGRQIQNEPLHTAVNFAEGFVCPPDFAGKLGAALLRRSLIANETNDEPKHPHVVARIQHLHCKPIAVRDSSDQHLVWCRLHFGLITLVASEPLGSRFRQR
jgi:hypothetical protein